MTASGEPSNYTPFFPFSTWADASVGGAWSEFSTALNSAREAAEPSDLQIALSIALRSAALETGAIEGLYATTRGITRTVALQGAMWEAELENLGGDVRGHFEAQLAGFDMVLDAATHKEPISEAWLRELHATVCATQATHRALTGVGWQDHAMKLRVYKTMPNNVILPDGTAHWYTPVFEVSAEMYRMLEEMRSDAFLAAHSVLQAAFAHHALTCIHPFADGNGRAARALSSVFLYRAAGIPLVIFSDQQEQYWDALAAADQGRPDVFVGFIDDRALDTMALVTSRLREAKSPLDQQAVAIRSRFQAHGGLSHADVQALGQRLQQRLHQTLTEQVALLLLGPDITTTNVIHSGHAECSFWDHPYHSLANNGIFGFRLQCDQPITAAAEITPVIGLADDTANPFACIVIDANRSESSPLKLRISDLYPGMTAAADSRIEGWVRESLSFVLVELQRGIDSGLQRQGFSAP